MSTPNIVLDPEQIFREAKEHGIDTFLNNMFATTFNAIEQLKPQLDSPLDAKRQSAAFISEARMSGANLDGDLVKWFRTMGLFYSAECIWITADEYNSSNNRTDLLRFEFTKRLEATFATVIVKFNNHTEYQNYLRDKKSGKLQ